MNNRFRNIVRISFILLDLLMLNLGYLCCRFLFQKDIRQDAYIHYFYFIIFLNIAWLFICWGGSIYQGSYTATFEKFARRTTHAYAYFVILVVLYLFFMKSSDISRLFVTSTLIVVAIGITFNRFMYLFAYHVLRDRPYLARNIAVLGYNELSKKLIQHLEQDKMNTKVIGYFENYKNVKELSHYPILGELSNVMAVSKEYNVNEIYSTIAPEQDRYIYTLMQEADRACIRFKLIPNFDFLIRQPVHVDYLNGMPILSIRKEPLEDVTNKIKKRFFDIGISFLVILLVLSWLIPLIGLLILLESKGPVFFIQQRTGRDNQPFPCIKFRSMKVNKDANQRQAEKNDMRVTRIGSFLRKTSLDEFPQFLNVFIGHMSLVGPRPHMLKHTDQYSELIKEYMVRQFLKPGITGWAQINGYRGETKTVEQMKGRVEHDIWYLENWSLWLDLRIIFLTAYNIIRGEENAF